MQMRQCEGAENELFLWVQSLFCKATIRFFLCPPAPSVLPSSWMFCGVMGSVAGPHRREKPNWSAFSTAAKSCHIIQLGLDRVVIHQAHNTEIEASTYKQTNPPNTFLLHFAVSVSTFFSFYLSHHLFVPPYLFFLLQTLSLDYLHTSNRCRFSDSLIGWPLSASTVPLAHTQTQTQPPTPLRRTFIPWQVEQSGPCVKAQMGLLHYSGWL